MRSPSSARACSCSRTAPAGARGLPARLPRSLLAGLLLAWTAASATAQPVTGAQRDPQLRSVVQAAINQAPCVTDPYDAAVWYTLMGPKLRRLMPDDAQRHALLSTVYCETHRPGGVTLPAGLVMAVIEVESRFDPWAVSSAGAVGLMQVMPFWPEQLGMRRYLLTQAEPNIRMGCAILRFYMQRANNDIRRALEYYNGSVGRREYPDRVIVRWTRYWTGADDLGRAATVAPATLSP